MTSKLAFSQLVSLAALAACSLFALSGCADSSEGDIHAAPRESKAYESVQVSSLDKAGLLAHLKLVSDEATAAAAAGEAIEFHHLEVALTPTLEALQTQAAGNAEALATIEMLKALAVKLHVAGHEGNVGMGVKLAASIASLTDELTRQLS